MIKLLARLLRVLNSETEPGQLSLGLCFAMIRWAYPTFEPAQPLCDSPGIHSTGKYFGISAGAGAVYGDCLSPSSALSSAWAGRSNRSIAGRVLDFPLSIDVVAIGAFQ